MSIKKDFLATYGSLVIETYDTIRKCVPSRKVGERHDGPTYAPWNTASRSGLFTLRGSFEEGSPLLRSGLVKLRGSFEESLLYYEADYSRLGAALKRVLLYYEADYSRLGAA